MKSIRRNICLSILCISAFFFLDACAYFKQIPIPATSSQPWQEGLREIKSYEGEIVRIMDDRYHYELHDFQVNGNVIQEPY